MNIKNANPKMIKMLLDSTRLQPIYFVSKLNLSQNAEQNLSNLFKAYSENSECFSDRYKPLTEDDYNRFFSKRTLRREPAITRLITSLSYKVGKKMISLAEGMPNEERFPFSKVQLQLKGGKTLEIDGQELKTALQYVPSQGLPSLLSSLHSFQCRVHRPPTDRDIIVTNGGQHAIYQCCDMLVNTGDPVLMAEHVFTGMHVAPISGQSPLSAIALSTLCPTFPFNVFIVCKTVSNNVPKLKPYNPEILSIPEDAHGIRPEIIDAVLSSRLAKGLKMPKVFYTIPVGNNPSGTVIPEERKRQIYELACKYDFLILEDDPYIFLKYDDTPSPSFLSLDSCGRVIRMDSFSKVLSPGLRGGWVTGPKPFIYRMQLHMQAELLHSCSLSQTILSKLMSDLPELEAHLTSLRDHYRTRRDVLHQALEDANLAEYAEWNKPSAGLYIWMKVKGVDDVYNMVFQTALERGLMLIPGHAFLYDTSAPSQYVRLAFSKAPVENMDAGARLLRDLIRDEQTRVGTKRIRSFAIEQ